MENKKWTAVAGHSWAVKRHPALGTMDYGDTRSKLRPRFKGGMKQGKVSQGSNSARKFWKCKTDLLG